MYSTYFGHAMIPFHRRRRRCCQERPSVHAYRHNITHFSHVCQASSPTLPNSSSRTEADKKKMHVAQCKMNAGGFEKSVKAFATRRPVYNVMIMLFMENITDYYYILSFYCGLWLPSAGAGLCNEFISSLIFLFPVSFVCNAVAFGNMPECESMRRKEVNMSIVFFSSCLASEKITVFHA